MVKPYAISNGEDVRVMAAIAKSVTLHLRDFGRGSCTEPLSCHVEGPFDNI